MTNKIAETVEKVISFFEKERFNLLTLFVWIFLLSATRLWTEAQLFDYPYKDFSYEHIFIYTHLIIFGYAVGIGAVLILKALTKEKVAKIVNLSALGGAIVIIPPLLDYFVFRRREPYRYIPLHRLMEMFSTHSFNLSEFSGIGLLVEILLILILTTVYVYIKTRSAVKAVANFFLFFGFIAFMVIPTINPLIAMWAKGKYGGLTQPVLVVYFLLIGLLLFAVLLKICRKDSLSAVVKTVKPLSFVPFVIVAIIGVVLAGHLDIGLSPECAGNIGTFGIGVFTVFFIWLSYTLMKYLSDIKEGHIEKGTIVARKVATVKQIERIVVILVITAVTLAANLSLVEFFLAVASILVAWIYSLKPVKKNKFLSSLAVGCEETIIFFIGCLIPSYTVTGDSPPFDFIKSSPNLSKTLIGAGLIILLMFFIISLAYKEGTKNQK